MFGSQLRCPKCNQYVPDRCTCTVHPVEEVFSDSEIDANGYPLEPMARKAMLRYSHLSGFTLRTNAEEEEAQRLHKRFGKHTGWTLWPRERI